MDLLPYIRTRPLSTGITTPVFSHPSSPYHTVQFEEYPLTMRYILLNHPRVAIISFGPYPRSIQQWKGMKEPIYLTIPGMSTNQFCAERSIDLVPAFTLKEPFVGAVPDKHLPHLGMQPEGQLFPILHRPAYVKAGFGIQEIQMKVFPARITTLPTQLQHIPTFCIQSRPPFALRESTQIHIFNSREPMSPLIDGTIPEGVNGQYAICSSLGYTPNNHSEILKLVNMDQTRAYQIILLLIDATSLHPTLPIELGSDSVYADKFMEKLLEWDADENNDKNYNDMFKSMISVLFQFTLFRRQHG